jgi:hypothetical protein
LADAFKANRLGQRKAARRNSRTAVLNRVFSSHFIYKFFNHDFSDDFCQQQISAAKPKAPEAEAKTSLGKYLSER